MNTRIDRAGWIGGMAAMALAATPLARAEPPAADAAGPMFDLSKEKVLYCVGYAHLDTQWRWDYPTTIDRFIRDTLEQNFERFDKHPGYVFNFTGSVRYEMMKEYYPGLYEQLKKHVAAGRWFVSGSSVDEGDANVPAPESIVRHVLYGNAFFRREFGRESVDFMLPDCFGFPASMPSIWAHCGLLGFSTQKLTWGSAVGIPFPIGVWEGPDGKSVIAALDPGAYVGAVKGRVDLNPHWIERIERNGERYGVWADYHYYGVGDQGGAPHDEDVANYLSSIDRPDSAFKVALVASDQMYKDITPALRAKLPRYKGDLLLTEHSAGTLTSQSYMKRWNRMAENLADAAERAATAAWLTGARPYPRRTLERLWVRTLANQMHDILPGTSIPRAYTYSWNDLVVAMNGFAEIVTDSTAAVAATLDTRGEGVPIVVFNPLAAARDDVVEARVTYDAAPPRAVRATGPDGRGAPCQVLARDDRSLTILFPARVGPASWSVFHICETPEAFDQPGDGPSAAAGLLENERLRVTINDAGDLSSIFDKKLGREMLSGPARLVFTYEKPREYPAWNMDWADRSKPPLGYAEGPVAVRVVEHGPVRAAVEVRREARGSIITQRYRLTGGDAGDVLEVDGDIDWQSTECALKASFTLAASNPMATYNWGLGTIERGNNEPKRYEVPHHEWLDLTDASGDFGVAILDNSKYGSDKPADNELRLTLLYTPGVRHSYLDQHSQDWGRHQITYAFYPHNGDWRESGVEWRARRLNQPLRAFQTTAHDGAAGKSLSLLSISTPQVDARAVKLAEDRDAVIVRLQELWGREAKGVTVRFHAPVERAAEVDGQERVIGEASVKDGTLVVDLSPYSPRAYAVTLGKPAPATAAAVGSIPLVLLYDTDVSSRDSNRADGAMDDEGRTYPGEQLPRELIAEGVRFVLGSTEEEQANAVTCRGQSIPLPRAKLDRVDLLVAATGDVTGRFTIGGRGHDLTTPNWTGFVGQWDNREWDRPFEEIDYRCEGRVTGITPGFIKRTPIAWFSTHRHHPTRGNEAYRFSYLFKVSIPAREGDASLTLPDDARIRVFAISAVTGASPPVVPAAPLYDDFSGRERVAFRHVYPAPPPPAFEGASPIGRAVREKAASFAELGVVGPPSAADAADRAVAPALVFRYADRGGEWSPHAGSGAKDGTLPRLNDGETAMNDDDTRRCVWFDHEGRFFVDLGRSLPIDRINTYSRHRLNRAPQYFSVWGSDADEMPDPGFGAGAKTAWRLLGVVDTRELGQGGVHASSIRAERGALGAFRHLLWIAEDIGEGTFFTEIDVYEAK